MKTQLLGIAIILFGIAFLILSIRIGRDNTLDLLGIFVALIGLAVTILGTIKRENK